MNIKKLLKDKKGQSIIELALVLIAIAPLIFFIFDSTLMLRAKAETMVLARNGVRYVVFKGISDNTAKNTQIAKEAKENIKRLYSLNHPTAADQAHIQFDNNKTVVENGKGTPAEIKTGNMGANPVYVNVCFTVHPLTADFFKSNATVCSSYMGFHSSKMQE